MRYAEFKLLEAKQQLFAIGDSHAAAIGSQPGWNNLATNGRRAESPANDAAIAKVPNGSLVVLSAGANNMLDPNKATVVSRVESLINKLKQKQCTVYYVLFASTDNPKFANDRNQLREMVKNAVGSDVGILDMGSLKYKPGTSDGIHAPMGWYIQAARTAASGAKEVAPRAGQEPQPATVSTAFSIEVPQTSLGWKGAGIMDVQKALVALGYDVGPQGTDGIRGKNTIAAVKKYQADRNLKVDGDPGPETVAALNKDIQSNPDKFKSVTKSNPSDIKQSPEPSGSSADGATADMDTLEMIKTFESFSPKAYWDHQQWSIGYGSFAGRNREKADIPGPISREQAEKMLKDHVQKFANDVERWNRVGKYNWNEGQKGALISFAYNIGSIGQLTDQGRRDNATIAKKMLEYITASGKPEPGLLKRRRVEQQKFIMNTPQLRQDSKST